jgi:hypothetical protein
MRRIILRQALNWAGLGMAAFVGAWFLFADTGATPYFLWKIGLTSPLTLGQSRIVLTGQWYVRSSSAWPFFSSRYGADDVTVVAAKRIHLLSPDLMLLTISEKSKGTSSNEPQILSPTNADLRRFPWGEASVSRDGVTGRIDGDGTHITVISRSPGAIEDFLGAIQKIEKEENKKK